MKLVHSTFLHLSSHFFWPIAILVIIMIHLSHYNIALCNFVMLKVCWIKNYKTEPYAMLHIVVDSGGHSTAHCSCFMLFIRYGWLVTTSQYKKCLVRNLQSKQYMQVLIPATTDQWRSVGKRRPAPTIKVTHFCNVVTSVLWCHEFQTRMECHVTIYGHSTPSLSMWVFVWQGSLRLESDRDVCLLFSDNISYARSVSEC